MPETPQQVSGRGLRGKFFTTFLCILAQALPLTVAEPSAIYFVAGPHLSLLFMEPSVPCPDSPHYRDRLLSMKYPF